jgi:tetratricopeptide (TPR) repeat protein/TolB-like protein
MPRKVLIGVAVTAVAACFASFAVRHARSARLATPPAVAVLSFENEGGDPATAFYCEGLRCDLVRLLGVAEERGAPLHVLPLAVAKLSPVRAGGPSPGSTEADLAVGVRLRRRLERVEATIEVSDVRRGRIVWTRRIADPGENRPVLLERLIDALGGPLGLRRSVARSATQAATVPRSEAVYGVFLEAEGRLERSYLRGNVAQAIALYRSALAADPDFAPARAGLAEARWRMYEATLDSVWIDRARAGCDSALAMDGARARALAVRSIVRSGTGDFDGALEDGAAAVEADSGSARTHFALARALDLARVSDDVVVSEYETAIALEPLGWESMNDLGVFFVSRLSDYERAVLQFYHATWVTPRNPRAYVNLAATLSNLGRNEEAIEILEQSIAIEPTYTAIHTLGVLYSKEEAWEPAREMFERATEVDPGRPEAWEDLGSALFLLGDAAADAGDRERAESFSREARTCYERAAAIFRSLVQRRPRDAGLWLGLAGSTAMLDRFDEARGYVERALELAPADEVNQEEARIVEAIIADRVSRTKRPQP